MTLEQITQNSPLPTKLRDKVSRYYNEADAVYGQILRGDRPNGVVMKPLFLRPDVKEGDYPLSTKDGEAMYYWGIRTAMELAIHLGHIPEKYMPANAPDEVRDLIKHENL